MGRAKTDQYGRPVGASKPQRPEMSLRMDEDLYARLRAAALERQVSPQVLARAAIVQFLDRLIPLEELMYTRENPQASESEGS